MDFLYLMTDYAQQKYKLGQDRLTQFLAERSGANRYHEAQIRAIHERFQTVEVTTENGPDLVAMVEEVASALNVAMPRIFLYPEGRAIDNFAIPTTHELIISERTFDILNKEQGKALIAHEMQHFCQKEQHSPLKKLFLLELKQWADGRASHERLGYRPLIQLVDHWLSREASLMNRLEFEADQIGASLTSRETMKETLLILGLDTLGMDFYALSFDKAVEGVERFLYQVSQNTESLIARGNHSFTERIARLEQSTSHIVR